MIAETTLTNPIIATAINATASFHKLQHSRHLLQKGNIEV